MKSLLIGNLTIDENTNNNKTYIMPGGAVFFTSRTFVNLGVDTTVLSPRGLDFPKNYLAGTYILPESAQFTKTLRFKNIYQNGKRVQWVKNYREYLQYFVNMSSREVPTESGRRGDLSNVFEIASSLTRNDKIVVIAPVINNISYQIIKKVKKLFPQSFFCLLPQGFFRKIGDQGEVVSISNDFPDEIISIFDFICLSELDLKDADIKAKTWSLSGPLVAVTKAERGSSIYKNGDRIDTFAFKVENIIDPTGAGDVFAAGFSFFYYKTRDLINSLDFAHAAAALSLRYRSFELQYTYQEILNFADSQKRGLIL